MSTNINYENYIGIYKTLILENYKEIESERKKLLKESQNKKKLTILISFGIFLINLICLVILYANNGNASGFMKVISGTEIILLFKLYCPIDINSSSPEEKFKNYLKDKINHKITETLNPDSLLKTGIEMNELRKSNFFPLYASINLAFDDNFFSGDYKGLSYKISETFVGYKLPEQNNNKKTQTPQTNNNIYENYLLLLFKLDSYRKNSKIIEISSNSSDIISSLIILIIILFIGLISLICVLFDNIFIQACAEAILPFILILPFSFVFSKKSHYLACCTYKCKQNRKDYKSKDSELLKKLRDLLKYYDSDKLIFSRYENKLLIGIRNNHDFFEIEDLEKPLTSTRVTELLRKDIKEIYNFMDYIAKRNNI